MGEMRARAGCGTSKGNSPRLRQLRDKPASAASCTRLQCSEQVMNHRTDARHGDCVACTSDSFQLSCLTLERSARRVYRESVCFCRRWISYDRCMTDLGIERHQTPRMLEMKFCFPRHGISPFN